MAAVPTAFIPGYSGTSFKVNGSANPTLGDVITAVIPYIYIFAGLFLLVMLILGGITLMTSAGNADKTKAGYGRITGALIGFLIVFISYFAVQLVEVIFGITIF